MRHGRKENPQTERVDTLRSVLGDGAVLQPLNASDQLTPGVYPQQINPLEMKTHWLKGDFSLE